MARLTSPALSESLELTAVSRFLGPVPEYTVQTDRTAIGSIHIPPTSTTLRGQNGRYISRKTKRNYVPSERSTKKVKPSTKVPEPPRTPRKHWAGIEFTSPTSEPSLPTPWVVGAGGLGCMTILPKEIRQIIFSHALDVDRPVTVKQCCGPNSTRRMRDACHKHTVTRKLSTGRFNVLFVSKATKHEAAWVLYNQGLLCIDVHEAIKPYLDGGNATSLRHMGNSIHKSSQKLQMWAAAACFRFVDIRVPESHLRMGNPAQFTSHLVEIACVLGKFWENCFVSINSAPSATHHVRLDIGSIFHQMLPFNMDSQAEEKYGELLDWITINSSAIEPDFERIAAESENNLKRLACVAGMHHDRARWRVNAWSQVPEEDKGGAKRLGAFQITCARNGVTFGHSQ